MEGDLMYHKIEENLRMTVNEAAERYPDSFILVQRDNEDICDPIGSVLYIGDDFDELFSLQVDSSVPLGIVIEGLNHRRSLGGVVVGE
jgi:hypothetical protein